MLLSRQPVLYTHDELYMQTLIDESAVHKPSCTVDVGSKISIAGSTLSFRICVAKPSTSGAILMNVGREDPHRMIDASTRFVRRELRARPDCPFCGDRSGHPAAITFYV